MPRLQVLTFEEENKLKIPPLFNVQQKEHIFSLPESIKNKLKFFDNDYSVIVFVLLYGYFQQTNRFYDSANFHQSDIEFVSNKFGLDKPSLGSSLPKRTIRRHKKDIKSHLAIQNSSIVHWSHINFYREYDFTRRSKKIEALTAVDPTKGFMQPIDQNVLDLQFS